MRRKFLDHGQQEFAIAVVEVCRIAANLGEKAKLLVGEFLRVDLASKAIFGKELSKGKVERLGYFGESIERGNGVAVLYA